MPTLGAPRPTEPAKADAVPALAPPITSPSISALAPPLYSANGLSSLGPVIDAGKVPPPPRGWMDKVADMILGTDPYGTTLEEQQYALICRGCMRHNGLVPKQEFDEVRACGANENMYAPSAKHLIRGDHQVDRCPHHLHPSRSRHCYRQPTMRSSQVPSQALA